MGRKNKKNKFYSNKKSRRAKHQQRDKESRLEKSEDKKFIVGTFEKSRNFGFVVPDGKKGRYRCVYI